MKRTIATIIILVLLLGFASFEQAYLHMSIDRLQEHTQAVLQLVKADPEHVDSEEKMKKANELIAYWDKHKHYFEMLLSHTYTLEVERNASVLLVHMEQNDYLMTSTDLSALDENCDLLREVTTPHFHTIF